jgi:hypothetical protein
VDNEAGYHRLFGDRFGSNGRIASLSHYPDRDRTVMIKGKPVTSSAAFS